MQNIICELQDMKHLDWAARKMSSSENFRKDNEEKLAYDLQKEGNESR